MRTLLLTTLAVASVAALAPCQMLPNTFGFTDGWDTSYTSRVGANTNDADVLNRIDNRDMQDMFLDGTGMNHSIIGFLMVTQDQDETTTEQFTVVGYNEDPMQADFPDTTTGPWFRTTPIMLPPPRAPTTPGFPVVAYIWTITLTAPVTTPKGNDLFLGISLQLPSPMAWPMDGISTHIVMDDPTAVNFDLPGAAQATINPQPNGTYACNVTTVMGAPQGPATYPGGMAGSRRQIFYELLVDSSGGMSVTQTNQPNLPASNPTTGGTGVTNFLSGLHPDLYDFNMTGRLDDIGFVYNDVRVANQPVFIMAAFGPSPLGSVPIGTFPPAAAPGSSGNVCIDFTTAAAFLVIADANGRAQQMLALNPSIRAFLLANPLDIWWQGLGINTLAGGNPWEIHTSGCVKQHL